MRVGMFRRATRAAIVALGRRARRLRRDERGATAVEFGLVAVPLLALLLAIIEAAMIFWAQQVLQTAVSDAARELYTGQFQNANVATIAADLPGKLKTEICSRVVAMFDCPTKLQLDLRLVPAFPFTVPPVIVKDSAGVRSLESTFGQFVSPGRDDIVVLRAIVSYPVFANLLGANASNLTATSRLLVASAAFKAEPF
jgi:Flp pilus assembly protein TadG